MGDEEPDFLGSNTDFTSWPQDLDILTYLYLDFLIYKSVVIIDSTLKSHCKDETGKDKALRTVLDT